MKLLTSASLPLYVCMTYHTASPLPSVDLLVPHMPMYRISHDASCRHSFAIPSFYCTVSLRYNPHMTAACPADLVSLYFFAGLLNYPITYTLLNRVSSRYNNRLQTLYFVGIWQKYENVVIYYSYNKKRYIIPISMTF